MLTDCWAHYKLPCGPTHGHRQKFCPKARATSFERNGASRFMTSAERPTVFETRIIYVNTFDINF
jgi:hypothetical protein